MIDFPAVLAELEKRRDQMQDAIDALKRLIGERVGVVANGEAPVGRVTIEIRAFTMWKAGLAVSRIARELGISTSRVYQLSSEHRWPARSPVRSSAELAGQVKCPACGEMTKHDPCSSCRKPVRR